MKFECKLILVFTVLVIVSSCTITKDVQLKESDISCLILEPKYAYHKVMCNPEWISHNQIIKMIEREYYKGSDLSIIKIYNYDSDGLLQSKYRSFFAPDTDSYKDIEVENKWIYDHEYVDSCTIRNYIMLGYLRGDINTQVPDTISTYGRSGYNLINATQCIDPMTGIIEKYKLDNQNRIIECHQNDEEGTLYKRFDEDGQVMYKIRYHGNEKIEVVALVNSYGMPTHSRDWLVLDDKNRIISCWREGKSKRFEFFYDEGGAMIKLKYGSTIKTYEYITKS